MLDSGYDQASFGLSVSDRAQIEHKSTHVLV